MRRRWAPQRVLLAGVLAALAVTTALAYAFVAPSDNGSERLVEPVFLLKMAFIVSVVFSALAIVRDLSCPGRHSTWQTSMIAVPFLVVALLSVNELLVGHPEGLEHDLIHASIMGCLWQIGMLAMPAFAVITAIVRSLAPVNLSRTGLYVGLLSGSIGAFGYAFHCHEDFVTIVAISYTLAIIQMGVFGALIGPRLLRWA